MKLPWPTVVCPRCRGPLEPERDSRRCPACAVGYPERDGILELVAAYQLRKAIDNEWWLALSGLASLVFGVIAIVAPGAGALALIWVIATYAIIFGVLELALAWRLHEHSGRRQALRPA